MARTGTGFNGSAARVLQTGMHRETRVKVYRGPNVLDFPAMPDAYAAPTTYESPVEASLNCFSGTNIAQTKSDKRFAVAAFAVAVGFLFIFSFAGIF